MSLDSFLLEEYIPLDGSGKEGGGIVISPIFNVYDYTC